MNETLKGLLALLAHPDPAVQCAAVQVLGALAPAEAGVLNGLAQVLERGDRYLAHYAVDALGAIGTPPAMDLLVRCLGEETLRSRAAHILARAGTEGEEAIARVWDRWQEGDREVLLAVLLQTRGRIAIDKVGEILKNPDWSQDGLAMELVKQSLSSFDGKLLQRLRTKVNAFLRGSRKHTPPEILARNLDFLTILGGANVASILLPFTGPKSPPIVRHAALRGLASMPPPAKAVQVLLGYLREADYTHVVGPTLEVLRQVDLPQEAEAPLLKILDTRETFHPQIISFALEAAAAFKSPAVAKVLLGYLEHPESWARARASRSLELNPAAKAGLQNRSLLATGKEEALLALKPLISLSRELAPAFLKKAFVHMEALRSEGNPCWSVFRDFLWQANPSLAVKESLECARGLRHQGAFDRALDLLLSFTGGRQPEPKVRYEIALLHLLKEPRTVVEPLLADPAMGHLQALLENRQLDVLAGLEKEDQLKADDLLYVGFHFLGRTPQLKEFGLRILELLARRWPHSKAARLASQKARAAGLEPTG